MSYGVTETTGWSRFAMTLTFPYLDSETCVNVPSLHQKTKMERRGLDILLNNGTDDASTHGNMP